MDLPIFIGKIPPIFVTKVLDLNVAYEKSPAEARALIKEHRLFYKLLIFSIISSIERRLKLRNLVKSAFLASSIVLIPACLRQL